MERGRKRENGGGGERNEERAKALPDLRRFLSQRLEM